MSRTRQKEKQNNSSLYFNHTQIQAKKSKKELLHAYKDVIDSGIFLEGPQNKKLVLTLQKFFHIPYVIPVASGHDALFLALSALQLQTGDEVIIPANAYPTVFPAALLHLKIILCDVDEQGQLSLPELQKKVTSDTKAVIMVHMYGLIGELQKIQQFLRKQKIPLIEDCAQAFGSSIGKKLVGTFGDLGCFSFYPTKNLGTLGDGGAVITKNKKYAQFIEQAKKYGEQTRYKSEFMSSHSRLPELQAASLNVYLKEFQKTARKKRALAQEFVKKLTRANLFNLRPLISSPGTSPVPHLFVIVTSARDELRDFLQSHGVETHIHYPFSIHQVPAYQNYLNERNQKDEQKPESFPVSQYLSEQMISLPFHQYLTNKDLDVMVKLCFEFKEHQLKKIHSLSMVFPAYNDALSLPSLIPTAYQTAQKITQDFEVIVVNDGSRDNTLSVLQKLQKKYSKLKIVSHSVNRGYGGAIISGLSEAKKEWVFYTDGDGQYKPEEIFNLIEKLDIHIDVVNGFKKTREDSFVRKFVGEIYNSFLHHVYSVPIRDIDCDFRLIKRSYLQKISLRAQSGLFCLELVTSLAKVGARFAEVEVSHQSRKYGSSQFFTPKHLWKTFRDHVAFFIAKKTSFGKF
jgi:dTDP-4-amino-4,6-dideoxygalactose transaminase